MMASVPNFLNSALQGFLPPLVDRVKADASKAQQQVATNPRRPYHVDFFTVLLQQRSVLCFVRFVVTACTYGRRSAGRPHRRAGNCGPSSRTVANRTCMWLLVRWLVPDWRVVLRWGATGRFAEKSRGSVVLDAPPKACAPYNATHNQHIMDLFVEVRQWRSQ